MCFVDNMKSPTRTVRLSAIMLRDPLMLSAQVWFSSTYDWIYEKPVAAHTIMKY